MIQQIAIATILRFMFYYVKKTDRRLPPGPFNFPIVGNLHWLAKFPWIYLSTLGKTYGSIATIKFGRTNVFVLNDIATWKEAYRQEEFSRHPGKVFESASSLVTGTQK
ncbi:unnamed protein product [Allacma fusca]|uniref:Cytochrome P450 n=1 Tax=Allacma fusca TaxID=39272 RepID=A0A8J2JEL0_9HEXA|nr:unnamed protein product [Allacma fusca]